MQQDEFFFIQKMEFKKKALSVEDQVSFLEKKGLLFKNKENAKYFLERVSYFRLKGYFHHFQKNKIFQKNIYFENIENLYIFDQKLRLLLFEAIERIETTFSTSINNYMSVKYNSAHWFLNPAAFKSGEKGQKNIYNQLLKDFNDNKDSFINHYREKYTEPIIPPFWAMSEIIPLGRIIYIYSSLKNNNKKEILKNSIKIPFVLSLNILHAIRVLRNACSHHQRIWNRNFTTDLTLPNEIKQSFTNLHSSLSYIKITAYILKKIGFNSHWNDRVIDLFESSIFNDTDKSKDIINFLKEL